MKIRLLNPAFILFAICISFLSKGRTQDCKELNFIAIVDYSAFTNEGSNKGQVESVLNEITDSINYSLEILGTSVHMEHYIIIDDEQNQIYSGDSTCYQSVEDLVKSQNDWASRFDFVMYYSGASDLIGAHGLKGACNTYNSLFNCDSLAYIHSVNMSASNTTILHSIGHGFGFPHSTGIMAALSFGDRNWTEQHLTGIAEFYDKYPCFTSVSCELETSNLNIVTNLDTNSTCFDQLMPFTNVILSRKDGKLSIEIDDLLTGIQIENLPEGDYTLRMNNNLLIPISVPITIDGINDVVFQLPFLLPLNCTSISTNDLSEINKSITIYRKQLTISSMENIERIQIMDMSGKLIQTLPSMSRRFDLSNLPNGIYLVKVLGDKINVSRKIIVF